MNTGLITFNVHDRGRQHTGQARNFDAAALAALVNSPAVQEKVRLRDMRGYFGHWPRRAFGIDPGEGGIFQGKAVRVEPAIITTTLRARPDGTIEHEAEFLDTPPGRTAKRLFDSRVGGFSSAIVAREYAGKDMPIGFYGFDYVTEPNYAHNRGYRLDSVEAGGEDEPILDEALRENVGAIAVLDGLYTRLQGDYENMALALARSTAETAELVAMLARFGPEAERAAKERLARLDDAGGGFKRPVTTLIRLDDARMMRDARAFLDMPLTERVAPADPETAAESRKLSHLVTSFFSGLRR